jgi:hypothetical protein
MEGLPLIDRLELSFLITLVLFTDLDPGKCAGQPMTVNVFVPDNVCGNKTIPDGKPSGQTL